MPTIVKNAFLFLLSVFLFILYIKNAHFISFLFLNNLVEIIIFILVIILIVFVVNKLHKWIGTLRFTFQIQVITSFFLILFLAHELFTPYFYQEDYLKEVGLEKIEGFQQLSNPELSNKERDELAKDVVFKEMAASYSITGSYPKVDAIEKMEIIDFNRHFNQFELTVEGKQPGRESVGTLQYTFTKAGLEFKIIGFEDLN